jgi:hypothetical protein
MWMSIYSIWVYRLKKNEEQENQVSCYKLGDLASKSIYVSIFLVAAIAKDGKGKSCPNIL